MHFLLESNIEFLRLPASWLVVLVIVPGIIAFSWWLYAREGSTAPARMKRLLAVVRALTILGFLALLAEPVRQQFDETTIRPLLAVLIDDSYSMSAKEEYRDSASSSKLRRLTGIPSNRPLEEVPRSELVTKALGNKDTGILAELEDRFDLEMYRFSSELQPIPSNEALKLEADGQSTRLGTAIEQAMGDAYGRDVAGLIVFTDGRSNAGTDPLEAAARARGNEVRLYAVGVGEPELLSRNAGIDWGLFPDSALVNQEVEFRVEVMTSGFEPNQIATLVLIDQLEGTELARESIAVDGPEPRQTRQFLSFQPTRPGEYEIVAKIIPPEGDENPIDDQTSPQTLWVKNEKIEVLYVEGYPRWEYRYLKNALIRADESLSTQCLLLSADLRFEQEHSADREDRILRQFPTDPKELFEFDVIVFGDVDPEDLHDDPQEREKILKNIKKFVEIGGGFLMIAGENYAPRSYVNTPIEDILPVVIRNLDRERQNVPTRYDRPFRPRLENPYDPHEIVKLRTDPEENRRLWESEDFGMPGLYWYLPVERAKPGARVLARHPETGNPRYGKHPLIVTTHYPTGRTLFLAFDSTWMWRKYYGEQYHEQFWLKAVQYLAMSKLRRSDKRYELTTKDNRTEYDIKEPITLWASVRDEDYEPLEADVQPIWIKTPKGRQMEMELPALPGEPGIFERELGEKEPGKYEAWIEVPGTAEKISHISFFVKVPVLETQITSLDQDRLREIALLTKGHYLRLHDLDQLSSAIEEKAISKKTLRSEEQLWDRPWILFALAGLLGLEWILRKRVQLV
ncbi:MAG: VWA domain-containing protein [Planctomycetota bacterium]